MRQWPILGLHRPVVDLLPAGMEGISFPVVPIFRAKVVPIGVGPHRLALNLARIGVDVVDYPAPGIDVPLVAGRQQRIAKAPQRAHMEIGAVGQFASLRQRYGQAPAIDAPLPTPPSFAPHSAVQPNVSGDDAAIFFGAGHPGIGVFK